MTTNNYFKKINKLIAINLKIKCISTCQITKYKIYLIKILVFTITYRDIDQHQK